MKFVVIELPESLDISKLPIGGELGISLAGESFKGTVVGSCNVADPPDSEIIPHTHSINFTESSGPAVPEG